MLPGPLGDAQSGRGQIEDCQARCSISSNVGTLNRCFDTLAMQGTDIWCDTGECSEAASCLRSALGDDRAIGVGGVRVSGVNLMPDDDNSCPSEQEGEAPEGLAQICMPGFELDFTKDDDGGDGDGDGDDLSYTVSPNYVILELISDTLPTILVAEGSCGAVIGRPHHAPNIPVGTYRSQTRVYDDSSNNCVLFEGALFKVTAGKTAEANYWILGNHTDPDTGEDVPINPVLCPESEANRCQDGLDNDENGLIDCDDAGCEDSGVCDTGDTGDTGNTDDTGNTGNTDDTDDTGNTDDTGTDG